MDEAAVIQRLRGALGDAEAALAGGRKHMHIVSTPRAMRSLGLRGRLVCVHRDGRRTYSVPAQRVIERVGHALSVLEVEP